MSKSTILKALGSGANGTHEQAVCEDKLVRPALGDKAKDTRQGEAPALTTVTVNEEYSSQEIEEGKHLATGVNVNTDKATLNFGGEHQCVYGIDDGAKKEVM